LVEYVTGLDARIGFPIEHLSPGYNEELKHPMFATGIGLVERAFIDDQKSTQKVRVKMPVQETVEAVEETVVEENVIETAKNKKVNNWWKDIFKGLPEWLSDENGEDFKD
jgi:cell division protein FtsA